jgi:hypothetical protein
MMTLPPAVLQSLAAIVEEQHVLTGDALVGLRGLDELHTLARQALGEVPGLVSAELARWLPLARTDAERALFARIRAAFDPSGTLNTNVLPRLSSRRRGGRNDSIAALSGPFLLWLWKGLTRASASLPAVRLPAACIRGGARRTGSTRRSG